MRQQYCIPEWLDYWLVMWRKRSRMALVIRPWMIRSVVWNVLRLKSLWICNTIHLTCWPWITDTCMHKNNDTAEWLPNEICSAWTRALKVDAQTQFSSVEEWSLWPLINHFVSVWGIDLQGCIGIAQIHIFFCRSLGPWICSADRVYPVDPHQSEWRIAGRDVWRCRRCLRGWIWDAIRNRGREYGLALWIHTTTTTNNNTNTTGTISLPSLHPPLSPYTASIRRPSPPNTRRPPTLGPLSPPLSPENAPPPPSSP